MVDVHVAGGNAGHSQPLAQLGEQAVTPAVVAPEGALELDAEALGAERALQPLRRAGRLGVRARLPPPGHGAVASAARKAHEPGGVALYVLEQHGGLLV